VPITADSLPDDLAALKRIIATMARDALVAQAEIARLKFQLARYRGPSAHGLDPWGAEFGQSSEKLAREAEQLELALEALETDQAERLVTASPNSCPGTGNRSTPPALPPEPAPSPNAYPQSQDRMPASRYFTSRTNYPESGLVHRRILAV